MRRSFRRVDIEVYDKKETHFAQLHGGSCDAVLFLKVLWRLAQSTTTWYVRTEEDGIKI